MATRGTRPPGKLLLAANDGWNIVNYRAGLIRALRAAGHELVVTAPAGAHDSAIRDLGVEFHAVEISPRGKSPIGDMGTFRAYRRLLKFVRPAAFLGFTAKPNIYGSIAARLSGIPVINNISGLGAAFVRPGPLRLLVEQLYRIALRRSATVFFQNEDDRNLFLRRGIVTAGQAGLLPGSGVDLAHFAPTGRPANARPLTFLLPGRLLWDKGIGEFVEAARRFREDRPDVRFQILGIVERESAAAVPRSKLQQWESEGLVDFLGSAEDVRASFAEADCVVLPSYYREGVPRVLLEAAAMAIPVITTDMPGCREAVDDGVTGILCRPRSVDSLIEALQTVARMTPAQRIGMGQAGRRRMEAKFSEERVHRAYIDALGKLGVPAS